MLNFNDFNEKQILYIFSKKDVEQKLKFWNDNIRLFENDKPINQVSCPKIFAVFIVGDISLTTVLLRNLVSYGVSVFFLKRNFLLYAFINSKAEGNYLLRQKQYRLKKKYELEISKKIIFNKIKNQYLLLKKYNKNLKIFKDLKKIEQKINDCKNQKQLLGIEGSHSKEYFAELFSDYKWYKRMPRTKVDINNLLMDIGYNQLFNFIDCLLNLFGFDTYKGVYHQLYFKRKSLSCDIMEPFRCIIDKQIIKAYNLKQINQKDFRFNKGSFYLPYDKQEKYVKILMQGIMDNKKQIYDYIKDYYYCIMNDNINFSDFKIK